MRENPLLNEKNKDRALGCLIGGAAGDALGYAVEFESWPSIRTMYGPKGITRYSLSPSGKALISDDTQMMLFTANAILLGMTRGCTRGVMGRIDTYCYNTYIDWLHTQEWDGPQSTDLDEDDCLVFSWLMYIPELFARRAPGNTCLSALKAIERNEEAHNDSCGCGGVMRTAPLAILDYLHGYAGGEYNYCDMVAAEAARITHKHPLGFLPSAVLNDILMQILAGEAENGRSLEDIVKTALDRLPSIQSEPDNGKTYGELWPMEVTKMENIVLKALMLAKAPMADVEAIERIGGGWTGHEALAIAIYSAVKHSDCFEDAIVSSVNHSGDSDSTGAICGNIMGMLLGRKAIPEYYTDDLELIDIIEEMAVDLFTGCLISEYAPVVTLEEKRWLQKYVYRKYPK
ncbi:MAG: ADP-ribosylglycohydrolase family protein [Bacteroidales bacterium]|nr:ADP-ribosylglycohydrolase family protein [Bacteroidales bacterium]